VYADPITEPDATRSDPIMAVAEAAAAAPGVPVVGDVMPTNPVSMLLAAAAGAARLVVVGSRGHGGASGLLPGSVSQHLIHHAECPVLLARP
jgi:nucleotide-binding universal stress UspA family protein